MSKHGDLKRLQCTCFRSFFLGNLVRPSAQNMALSPAKRGTGLA